MSGRILLLVQGISGSGKTTFARKWAEENPLYRVRLNYDDIRSMFGKYWVPEREDLVECSFKHTLNLAMEKGMDICIDNMSNLNPKHIEEYKTIVNHWNSNHIIKYRLETKLIYTPLEECIRRDSLRPNPIGEKIIKQQWRKYGPSIVAQYYKTRPTLDQDVKLPHCIIADMDGTICFNTLGRPFYGPEAINLCRADELNEPIGDLIFRYCSSEVSESAFIIITGRDESMRKATEDWLDNYWLAPTKLLMRESGDFRPTPEVKKEIFENYIKDKYYVDFVLEDNINCIEMWKDLGLTCLQV